MSRRICSALDLVDDAAMIADYDARHAPGAVWPAVIAYIRARGVEEMEIWRTGDRLFLVAQVADDYPRAIPEPVENADWEVDMWRFQRALPTAPDGAKWAPMERVFSLDEQ